jgi:hypothetical protein
MGTVIDRLGDYGFRGTVTAGGGSNQKGGKIGARYVNLRQKRKRQQRKVGHEEEGSSSNRPELVAFVLALRSTPVTNPMLYLCDNQALLKAAKKWVGEGGKATLVGVPDADILMAAIQGLQNGTTAGATTFLVNESASRRTCERSSQHPSRQVYFRQRCSHGMARQDTSSSLHIERASPERRYGEL